MSEPNGWSVERAFHAFGVTVGLRGNDPGLVARMTERLPPGARQAGPGDPPGRWYGVTRTADGAAPGRYRIFADGAPLAAGFRLAPLLDVLDADIRMQVGSGAPDHLFIHAGVVGWRGRTILLPGRSGTGKSTLVAALVRAGAQYFSDEYAVIASDGVVHPYARALSLRQGNGEHRVRVCPVRDLRGSRAVSPLRAGLILDLQFRQGGVFGPRRLSAGQATLALLAQTLVARDRTAFALAHLARLNQGIPAYAGDRGEADSAARHLLALADSLIPFNSGASS